MNIFTFYTTYIIVTFKPLQWRWLCVGVCVGGGHCGGCVCVFVLEMVIAVAVCAGGGGGVRAQGDISRRITHPAYQVVCLACSTTFSNHAP